MNADTFSSDVESLSSGVAVQSSDVEAFCSDIAVLSSDITALSSGVEVFCSGIAVLSSDVEAFCSGIAVQNSDVEAFNCNSSIPNRKNSTNLSTGIAGFPIIKPCYAQNILTYSRKHTSFEKIILPRMLFLEMPFLS